MQMFKSVFSFFWQKKKSSNTNYYKPLPSGKSSEQWLSYCPQISDRSDVKKSYMKKGLN